MKSIGHLAAQTILRARRSPILAPWCIIENLEHRRLFSLPFGLTDTTFGTLGHGIVPVTVDLHQRRKSGEHRLLRLDDAQPAAGDGKQEGQIQHQHHRCQRGRRPRCRIGPRQQRSLERRLCR
jgi:hypothetical protein